jgi:hypothetical protein
MTNRFGVGYEDGFSGGYTAGFQSVREYASHVDVVLFERRPLGKGCIVTTTITFPVAFALIRRTTKSVRFEIERADLACGE